MVHQLPHEPLLHQVQEVQTARHRHGRQGSGSGVACRLFLLRREYLASATLTMGVH